MKKMKDHLKEKHGDLFVHCDFGKKDDEFNYTKRPKTGNEAPVPKACSYTYSAWGPCVNGIQTRTVIKSAPKNCTGTPLLTRTCTTPPPPPPPGDSENPTAPTGLFATNVTETSITLNWNPSSDNVGVVGYRAFIDGTPSNVATTTKTFSGLTGGTSYSFFVNAYDGSGNTSLNSDTLVVQTLTTPPPPTTPPTVTISASPSTVSSGGSSTITWSSTNADSCTASGDWSGVKATSGSQLITNITGSSIYILTATGAGGSDTKSASVTVGVAPPPPPPSGNPAVVLLDFDGYTVSGTYWNTNGTDIVCAGSGLTSSEQSAIVSSVANDYKNYDVLITTSETVYAAAAPAKRQRVVITETWEWYGTAGGVAFIGSMFWGNETPCFVFSSLLSYTVNNVYKATSHEVGHTVGLRHQSVYDANCSKTAEYNPGDCSYLPCQYAPIMGVSYSKIPAWWIGPNSTCCTCTQDDNAIITTNVGLKS